MEESVPDNEELVEEQEAGIAVRTLEISLIGTFSFLNMIVSFV